VLINAYTVAPEDIKPGDEMLFVVKAMVGHCDPDGTPRYRLYRCRWEGTEYDIPQGNRITNDAEKVCKALFPTLAAVGKPDR